MLGVSLIIISMLINVFLGLRRKDWERAIFSPNGICGLVFYGTALTAGASTILLGESILPGPVVAGGIAVSLLAIFLKHPLTQIVSGEKVHLGESIGTFIIENFFEMFEVLLSYVSNTLSFLRVGGFVLSHAGMMLVVNQLTNMVSSPGASILVIVLGNIFVMALEGLIVGIQALRLEFYEMFSRFMVGSGKEFSPIRIGGEKE